MASPGEGEARAATSFPDKLGPPPYRAHLWSKTFFFLRPGEIPLPNPDLLLQGHALSAFPFKLRHP